MRRRDRKRASREEAASIDIGEGKALSGVVHAPDSPSGIACVVGHGAGSDMRSPHVAATAAGLAARGHVALRFNFPYSEAGARFPDRMPVLEQAYRAAAAWLRSRERGGLLVLGGRSLGGRVASHLAAEGFACDGLVFYGYPLHPANKPNALRDEHLPRIQAPMLFVQGTRDALCDLDLLRPVLARIGPRASLHLVHGADHSFDVLKSSGRTAAEVQAEVAGAVDAWLRARRG
jgi:uncharacterized protein